MIMILIKNVSKNVFQIKIILTGLQDSENNLFI